MEERKRQIKGEISYRIRIFYMIFTVVVLVFFGVMVWLQLSGSVEAKFEKLRKEKIIKTSVTRAHRGTIYSRNNEPLATSITRVTLYLDYGSEVFDDFDKYCKSADTLSRKLAAYFGDRSAKSYYEELIRWRKKAIHIEKYTEKIEPKWYQFFKEAKVVEKKRVLKRAHITRRLFRDVDLSEWQELRQYPLFRNGFDVTYSVERHDYRVYPQGDIALRTIGRNEPEHRRQYGIEYALRDTLAGHNGVQTYQIIAPGYKTRVRSKENVEAKEGYDVVTTLDVDVQDVADNALAAQLVKENAIWGTTIVMECKTGDILAMANLKRNGEECVEEQNYAIGVPVNPGSTFKLASTMALLENGVPASTKYDSGRGTRVQVGGSKGAWVQDSHRILQNDSPVLDMRTAFAESANVYFTKAVYDAFSGDTQRFSDFVRNKLHMHEKVGLEYLGARSGVIPNLSKKHPSKYNALVNMAYGYNMDITPLNMLTLYNAVANGGKMVAPRLILRTERDGDVVEECPVKVIENNICSKPTLDTLRSFMEEVSLKGTAAAYFGEKSCLFRTGSKTGTAQVNTTINGVRYNRGDGYYLGSMVTYLPADNPRYTIFTAIFTKRQTGKSYYGAGLSGPVQKSVATYLYNRDKDYAEEVAGERCYTHKIKGGNIEDMREVASKYGRGSRTDSNKGWGKATLGENEKIKITSVDCDVTRVPNVVGMGLADALYLLERSGLVVEIRGEGAVVKQSLAAGSEVNSANRKIVIELR